MLIQIFGGGEKGTVAEKSLSVPEPEWLAWN
jgi:hypothetical protein